MKFINLGGATGILEHKGKRILFDPWLDEGIFHGAWHHYPTVNLPEGKIEGLGRFDYIYISHIHEDHCSLGTLEKLNSDAEIIIMDRKPNFVLQFLKKNNLEFKKIHLVPPYKKMRINEDFEVAMVTADPSHELNYLIDSGLLIQWDDFVIYNSNDCPPYKEALDFVREQFPKVDLALLPYSTGSSYPSCFKNLSHDEKLNEKARLFKMGIDLFNGVVQQLNARYVMPFADQYVVVGSKHDLNRYMPNPSSPGVVRTYFPKNLNSQLLLLNSGQAFDFESQVKSPVREFYEHSDEEKALYAREHANELYDYEKFRLSKSANLQPLVDAAARKLFERLKAMKYVSTTKMIIEVTDWKQKYLFDLSSYEYQETAYDLEDRGPYLKVSVPANLLMLMLVGHISWNIADAALFIEYDRVPNVYDPKIQSLWNYLKI